MKLPVRRILALSAGVLLIAGLAAPQKNAAPEAMLRAAMDKETVDGDLKGAIEQYKKVIATRGASREVIARALVRLGQAYEKQGNAEARPAYERVVREFADQAEAAQEARAHLQAGAAATAGISLRKVCEGPDCNGHISPNGRYIATQTSGDLWVLDLVTKQKRQITHMQAPRYAFAPEWAPDGNRVAYSTAERSAQGLINRQVFIVNGDGSGSRMVHSGGGAEGWAPDGKRLLVDVDDKDKFAWLTLANNSLQVLPAPRTIPDLAHVSPDGKYIAYNVSYEKGGEENLYVAASDGSGEFAISPNSAYQEPLGWTPDGRLLYGQYGDSITLWTVSVAGGKIQGEPQQIREAFPAGTNLSGAGVSSSGAFYYRVQASTADLYTASMDPATGKVTSSPVLLPLPRTGHSQQAHWSPDGKRILHGWGQPVRALDTQELSIYSFDTGKDQRVASGVVVYRRAFCWSADGASIMFNTPRSSNPLKVEPVRFNLATGEATALFPGAASFVMDTCAAAHDLITGETSDTAPVVTNQGNAVKVRNLKTGAETEVYRGRPLEDAYISRDGQWVAFRENAGNGIAALYVVPAEGGPRRELAKVTAPASFVRPRGMTWSLDSRYLYFITQADANSDHELFRVPVSGGPPESTGLKMPRLSDLEISPDGARVELNTGGQQLEMWEMKDFLTSK